ncbi:uncharacterized protein [Oscarella lobularis]|uniref:uncharacterized protein isoform X2 n=1 Tax=Oscarella lobularis TaxID=121494 RepID=UPI0033140A54
MVGGKRYKEISDPAFVLDFDNRKSYEIHLSLDIEPIWLHTLHSVTQRKGTSQIFVVGGRHINGIFIDVFNKFTLRVLDIEEDLQTKLVISNLQEDERTEEAKLEKRLQILLQQNSEVKGEHLRLRRELSKQREELASVRREASSAQRRLEQQKDDQIASIRRDLANFQSLVQTKDEEIFRIRTDLEAAQDRLMRKNEEIAEEMLVPLMRCETLEASRDEMKRCLDEFTDVLNINPDEVYLSETNLGSGSFAGVSVGHWRGMSVAVKKINELIMSQRNEAMFKQEVLVCSRLHHPNIMVVCGAVMTEGAPLQIVMELLEGSVSEVIDAAHASGSYLTIYEQLSIVMDMTSGIAYLHQMRPRPYVHGDIRPSNALVTRDMKVKIGDLGAAHIIESSLSAGPMSPSYLAPERAGSAATSSMWSSDVYSMGVSFIEVFTGVGPIPEQRHTQLDVLANRSDLFVLCSRLIGRDPANRLSAQTCFETLKSNFAHHETSLSEKEVVTAKRLVKGVVEKDTHSVILINISLK